MTEKLTAKKYLSQARYLDADINSRQQELDSVRKNLSSIQSPQIKEDVIQESRKGAYDEKFIKLFEIDDDISEKIDELVNLKDDISKRIDNVEDRLSVVILRYRYVNMLEFHEIANKLQQSERHITRLHGDALVKFHDANIDLFMA